jgi:hypothetical protein
MHSHGIVSRLATGIGFGAITNNGSPTTISFCQKHGKENSA